MYLKSIKAITLTNAEAQNELEPISKQTRGRDPLQLSDFIVRQKELSRHQD